MKNQYQYRSGKNSKENSVSNRIFELIFKIVILSFDRIILWKTVTNTTLLSFETFRLKRHKHPTPARSNNVQLHKTACWKTCKIHTATLKLADASGKFSQPRGKTSPVFRRNTTPHYRSKSTLFHRKVARIFAELTRCTSG